MTTEKQTLPIGYWLKRTDELLTRRIDEAQRANGLTRLEWQTLNAVRDTEGTRDELTGLLGSFADRPTSGAVLDDLLHRGVVMLARGGRHTLTESGLRLHRQALQQQQQIRQRAIAGISETDYATTVLTLQRLVRNLEHDDDVPDAHP